MRKLCLLLPIVCVLTQLISMLLFGFTFFNAEEVFKTNNNNNLETNQLSYNISNDLKYKQIHSYCQKLWSQKSNKPLFNKMVLVVIDALRADFIPSIDDKSVHNKRMPFTESIMKTNGIGLVSISSTPTVTMPRIKAMISGTLPSFMDYILNLSAYKFNGENIVENAFKANKKTVFYGDDTWIHVLPQQVFYRSNGTSSFFATDYIEVDTNVTYNIDKELKQLNDWDIMIAHYLGVDHIGHSHGGHNSNLMPKKLLEMDNVIKNIYETVSKNAKSEPYLIVITGDHGMTDVGNHGGNTLEETETALIFLSTHKTKTNSLDDIRAERILQIDIASTLSSLMGLPLPNKNRGKIILSVLDAFYMDKDEQSCHLFSNAVQIDSLITPELSSTHKKVIQQAFEVHISLIEDNSPKTKTNLNYKSIIDSYNSYINLIQTDLLTKATKRSIFSLLTLSVILAIVPIFGILFVELKNSHSVIFTKVKDIQTVFAYTSLILNCVFLLSTSYIESEHYYWYLMTSTFTLIHMSIAIRNYSQTAQKVSLNDPFSALRENNLLKVLACFVALIILRVSNYWNHLYDYDIGEWFIRPENKRLLSALVICSLIAISYLMSTKRFGKQQCLLISGLVWVYLYRSDCGTVSSFRIPYFPHISHNFRAQLVFFHVSLIIFETVIKRLRIDLNWSFLDNLLADNWIKNNYEPVSSLILRTICTIWILLSALFSKVHNIPLLAINIILEKLVNYAIHPKDDSYKLYLAVTYLCFAESAFFSAGNSNTLSTIDVSPAFIGLDSYQPLFAGLFMIINMYSSYVYWILMLFIRLKECKRVISASSKLASIVNLILVTRFITVFIDMCVTIALQNHLFIWSVLCPKFLYEAIITLINEVIIICVVFNHIID